MSYELPQNPDDPAFKSAFALVHEGWAHLKLNRPIAAWACWQSAVRLDPGQPAAQIALDRLKASTELPETARLEYRFRTTTDETRRLRWDAAFQGQDLADLGGAARTFARLVAADPDDAEATENLALCYAWLGQNVQAVEALDSVIALTAETDFNRAVVAGKLSEILRQGGGAESLAQDFSHAIDLSASGDRDRNLVSLARQVVLRRLPSPVDPAADPTHRSVAIEEWLDRDWPDSRDGRLRLDEIPRVLAIVISTDQALKLALPSVHGLRPVLSVLEGLGIGPIQATRTPLPLATLDAAVWTIRLPEWVDDETRRRLYREAVEDYYENQWIHLARSGLGELTPLKAAQLGTKGDIQLRAKLEAAIAIREELSARPASIELYQGYPFDRVRKRLDLPLKYPEAVDETDRACMSGPDLDKLVVESLDDEALAEAFRSAASLGEDTRTVRFAEALAERRTDLLAGVDLKDLFACLIRHSLRAENFEAALEHIDQALELDQIFQGGRQSAVFTLWRAELLARIDEPDEASRVYQELMQDSDSPAWIAIDGASTLIDNGHVDQGRDLAEIALNLAEEQGDDQAAQVAEDWLNRLDS